MISGWPRTWRDTADTLSLLFSPVAWTREDLLTRERSLVTRAEHSRREMLRALDEAAALRRTAWELQRLTGRQLLQVVLADPDMWAERLTRDCSLRSCSVISASAAPHRLCLSPLGGQ